MAVTWTGQDLATHRQRCKFERSTQLIWCFQHTSKVLKLPFTKFASLGLARSPTWRLFFRTISAAARRVPTFACSAASLSATRRNQVEVKLSQSTIWPSPFLACILKNISPTPNKTFRFWKMTRDGPEMYNLPRHVCRYRAGGDRHAGSAPARPPYAPRSRTSSSDATHQPLHALLRVGWIICKFRPKQNSSRRLVRTKNCTDKDHRHSTEELYTR